MNNNFVTLERLRQSLQLTVEKASEYLGISECHLRAIEKGRRNPSDDLKIRMMNFYGITIDELFPMLCVAQANNKKKMKEKMKGGTHGKNS